MMDKDIELLMIGMSSLTHRVGKVVIKTPRIDEEASITQENARATATEANVYMILGKHPRIAECLYISPTKDLIALEYYHNGTLKDHIIHNRPKDIQKWAQQMIEGIVEIHSRGVRHSDIRLDQWLLDSELNARLSDFNASGHDGNTALSIPSTKAMGLERVSHFMPRDPDEDNTVQSDLFALGSALYELCENGTSPFGGEADELITSRFEQGVFPSVSHIKLGRVIAGCWNREYSSAVEVLRSSEEICGTRHG